MIAADTKEGWRLPASRRPIRPSRENGCGKVLAVEPGRWGRDERIVELRGHENIVVCFSQAVTATLKQVDDEWLFELPAIGICARAGDPEEARQRAADQLAAEVNRLVRAFADELTREERERKTELLGYVDLLGGELGLDFPHARWLLGRVKGSLFVPVQADFSPIGIPPALLAESDPEQLWFARVATFRDGKPKGEVLELELAPHDGPPSGAP